MWFLKIKTITETGGVSFGSVAELLPSMRKALALRASRQRRKKGRERRAEVKRERGRKRSVKREEGEKEGGGRREKVTSYISQTMKETHGHQM